MNTIVTQKETFLIYSCSPPWPPGLPQRRVPPHLPFLGLQACVFRQGNITSRKARGRGGNGPSRPRGSSGQGGQHRPGVARLGPPSTGKAERAGSRARGQRRTVRLLRHHRLLLALLQFRRPFLIKQAGSSVVLLLTFLTDQTPFNKNSCEAKQVLKRKYVAPGNVHHCGFSQLFLPPAGYPPSEEESTSICSLDSCSIHPLYTQQPPEFSKHSLKLSCINNPFCLHQFRHPLSRGFLKSTAIFMDELPAIMLTKKVPTRLQLRLFKTGFSIYNGLVNKGSCWSHHSSSSVFALITDLWLCLMSKLSRTQLHLPVHLLLLSSHLSFCKVHPLLPAVTSFLALNKSTSRERISSLRLELKPKSE